MSTTRKLPSRLHHTAYTTKDMEKTRAFYDDRFLTRARALFYARLAFLVLGLGVIGVPAWSAAFGIGGHRAFVVYLVMVAYSAVNYGIRPLGAVVGGWLGTAIGLRPTLVVAGVGGTLAAVWLLASPVRRIVTLDEA